MNTEADLTELQKRALERKKKITVKKTSLHDEISHHSFHFELNISQSWNLLTQMSIQKWESETGNKAPTWVDKTKVRIITLDERYDDVLK